MSLAELMAFPRTFPAEMYTTPNYTGVTQDDGANNWNDVARSKILLDKKFFVGHGEGIWVSNREMYLDFTINARALPFQHKVIVTIREFYSETTPTLPVKIATTPTILQNFLSLDAADNDRQLLNDAGILWNSAIIHFAPLYGSMQVVRLKYDDILPIASPLTPIGGVEILEAGWIRPDTGSEYLPLSILTDTSKKLRIAVKDENLTTGLDPSGIWRIKGAFDILPTIASVANNKNIFDVLSECSAILSSSGLQVKSTLAAHPLTPCDSTTNYPLQGIITPVEANFGFSWGDPSSSSFEEQGSFADGQHVASIWYRDMAANENASFYLFKTDRYAPCDNVNHTCSVTFKDGTTGDILADATVSGNLKVAITLDDGNGSGIDNTGTGDNIRLLIGRQVAGSNDLTWIDANGNLTGNFTVTSTATRDKDCETILNDGIGVPWGTPAYFSGGYVASLEIPVDFTTAPEGDYWFFVCAKDVAGNWSYDS